jgi:DNA-binding NarL/FixJ family response regulator
MTVLAETTQISVLLADDEPLVRAGLAMLIDAEGDLTVVGEAGDGAQAVELVTRLRPDVVVMDVRMPGFDGVRAIRRLFSETFAEESQLTAAVLVLTTFNDDRAVHDALRAGASGFLLKNAAPKCLGDAIRAVAAGDAWLDPAVARTVLTGFVGRPESALPTAAELKVLTQREREVLALVADGLSNAAIAAHLVISNATVKTHLGRVLMKLGLHDRAQAVAVAYKFGLVHPQNGAAGLP